LGELQGAVRSAPAALLAKKVVIGEGATEAGMVRRLFTLWDAERTELSQVSSTTAGMAAINGGGDTSSARRARALALLGYTTALVIDNDRRPVDADIAAAEGAGVRCIRWQEDNALEDEIVAALGDAGLQDLLEAAADNRGEESVRAAVAARIGEAHEPPHHLDGFSLEEWIESGVERPTLIALSRGTRSVTVISESLTINPVRRS
jgi:hypothetical protein